MMQHRVDVRSIETHPVVDHFQRQRRSGFDHEGEWIINLDIKVDFTDPQSPASLTQRNLARIVFKNKNAFEQRQVTRHVAPSVKLDERRVLILPRLELLLLQTLQPRQQRHSLLHLHPYRQRVDKQSDHIFSAKQRRRTPGDSSPKNNVVTAALSTKQQSPRTLEERVHRQLMLMAQRLEAAGQIRGQ